MKDLLIDALKFFTLDAHHALVFVLVDELVFVPIDVLVLVLVCGAIFSAS